METVSQRQLRSHDVLSKGKKKKRQKACTVQHTNELKEDVNPQVDDKKNKTQSTGTL